MFSVLTITNENTKEQKETFRGDGYVCDFDYSNGFTVVCMYPSSLNYIH